MSWELLGLCSILHAVCWFLSWCRFIQKLSQPCWGAVRRQQNGPIDHCSLENPTNISLLSINPNFLETASVILRNSCNARSGCWRRDWWAISGVEIKDSTHDIRRQLSKWKKNRKGLDIYRTLPRSREYIKPDPEVYILTETNPPI